METRSGSSDHGPVDRLAEEFLERHRRGECPEISEYAERCPEWADEIREVFPALLMMEQLKPPIGELTGSHPGPADGPGRPPERLGEYRILREIGRGGMGVVYEAIQESLGRHVALKVLPWDGRMDAGLIERFRLEASSAARLHHTNIVPVFGVGEHGGVHYYSMQFIHGTGLDVILRDLRRLRDRGPTAAPASPRAEAPTVEALTVTVARAQGLMDGPEAAVTGEAIPEAGPADFAVESGPVAGPEAAPTPHDRSGLSGPSEAHYFRSVARIGSQVADALAYAHSHKVLHRDIKPSNLLLDSEGRAWVADFGLAKIEGGEGLTRTGDFVGTYRYMAPERFQGRSDPRSDVYGLGATLYELLTLRPAFGDIDRARLIDSVLHDPPTAPRRVDPHIPRDLETVVLKALAKDPADRYSTARELAEDLRRFRDDRPILSRRARLPERAWRWCRRNPAVSGLSLGVGLVLLWAAVSSFLAAGWYKKQRDVERRATSDLRAERDKTLSHLGRAERAERERTTELVKTLLAQARAGRLTGEAGQSFGGLAAIRRAVALVRPEWSLADGQSLELRNEAIACLATPDVRPVRELSSGEFGDHGFGGVDPSFKNYASVDREGVLTLRHLADNREFQRFPPPRDTAFWYVHHIFSSDGQFLAIKYLVSGDRGPCVIWDLRSEAVVLRVEDTMYAGFGDDNRTFVAPTGNAITLYGLPDGRVIKRLGPVPLVDRVRVDPDGRRLVCSCQGDRTLRILDIESGKTLATFVHQDELGGLNWSRDGRYVAVGSRDRRTYVYDATEKRLQSVLLGHDSDVNSLGFSPEGPLITWGWDGTTRLWDPVDGRPLVRVTGTLLRISLDGRSLALQDRTSYGVWEVTLGDVCRTLHHGRIGNQDRPAADSGPYGVDFGRDGRLMASASGDGIRLWDAASGREVAHLAIGRAESVRFDPRGEGFITYGRAGLHFWPMQVDGPAGTAVELRVGPPRRLPVPGHGEFARADWDRRGDRVAITDSGRGRALVLDRDHPDQKLVLPDWRGISSIALSPDGRWAAATAWKNGNVRVWEATTGAVAADLPGEPADANAHQVAFSPDGRWLVAGSDWAYRWWSVGPWTPGLRIVKDKWNLSAPHLSFSRDGRMLAITPTPHVVRIVEPDSGRELATLTPPSRHVIRWLAFSPDGGRLAVATQDDIVHLWDLHRLGASLSEMHLDWDRTPAQSSDPQSSEPLRVRVDLTGFHDAD